MSRYYWQYLWIHTTGESFQENWWTTCLWWRSRSIRIDGETSRTKWEWYTSHKNKAVKKFTCTNTDVWQAFRSDTVWHESVMTGVKWATTLLEALTTWQWNKDQKSLRDSFLHRLPSVASRHVGGVHCHPVTPQDFLRGGMMSLYLRLPHRRSDEPVLDSLSV